MSVDSVLNLWRLLIILVGFCHSTYGSERSLGMISVHFEEQSLAEQPIWHGRFVAELSPRAQETVFAKAETIQHKAGATIFREGDRSQYLFIIKSG